METRVRSNLTATAVGIVAGVVMLAPPILWVTFFTTLDLVGEPVSGPSPIAHGIAGLVLPLLVGLLAFAAVRRARALGVGVVVVAGVLLAGLAIVGHVNAPLPPAPVALVGADGVDLEATLVAAASYAEEFHARHGRYPRSPDEYFHNAQQTPLVLSDGLSFGLTSIRTWGPDGTCVSVLSADQIASWSSEDDLGIAGLGCESR